MKRSILVRTLSISTIVLLNSVFIHQGNADDSNDKKGNNALIMGGAIAGLGIAAVGGTIITNKLKDKSSKSKKKSKSSFSESSHISHSSRPFADSTPPWQESLDISAYNHTPSTPWDHSSSSTSSPSTSSGSHSQESSEHSQHSNESHGGESHEESHATTHLSEHIHERHTTAHERASQQTARHVRE